jgi:nicotinate-nucleotide--dimethylbenzimidazole phosphoribosyltransferase
MVKNFVKGGAAISVLCRQYGIAPLIVDAGVNSDPEPGALDRKIARGTRNFAVEPAMSLAEAEQALSNGARLARELKADVAGAGEMGIGNTTAASALLCAFAGVSPAEAAGTGAGIDAAGVGRKAVVIRRALELHKAGPSDPIRTLASVGGFEIAMLAGFLLGAASRRLPVVIDGFIAGSAALAARSVNPLVMDYLIFSHRSAERAHGLMLEALGARPLLELEMRLGEGTGAAIAISLLEAALGLYTQMATFAEGKVSSMI